jgi:hypothetical protein
MKNLRLYITPEQYKVWSGTSGWPTYDDFMDGARPEGIDTLVDRFIDYHVNELGMQFPIRTKTSCQSKWTWSTIYLNQLATASCHRVKPVPFKLEEFDNFHNIPKKLEDRRLMLKGEWPTGGCEYCKDIEDAGGWSDRLHNLDIPGLTPPELETDPTAVSVTPRIVEIFAQNTCNLACVYCNGNLSSKIEQENLKFGKFDSNNVTIPIITASTSTSAEYLAKFLSWLELNVQSLVRLHLLGGETFLQHELVGPVLDIIEKYPSPNLELCLFSNLNVSDKYWDLYTGRIKSLYDAGKIKCFDLTASIDCWGPEASYVRSGLNLTKFEERFAWAAAEGKWIRLNVNQTVTSMTIKTMPDLINMVAKYNKNKHIGHYFQFYTGPHMFQHPKNFSYEMWEKDFDAILAAMPTDTVHQQEAIPRMIGLQKQLQQSTEHNYKEIQKLHVYLDELDRRRNTNWRTLFSYLDTNE